MNYYLEGDQSERDCFRGKQPLIENGSRKLVNLGENIQVKNYKGIWQHGVYSKRYRSIKDLGCMCVKMDRTHHRNAGE